MGVATATVISRIVNLIIVATMGAVLIKAKTVSYTHLFDMVCETNIIITRKVLFSSTLGNATALPRPPFQMGD